ncbi:MAG: hypothetical protein HQL82_14900 [Magnetococcales bacterium]|nr:hypothetical protein [Magnetococcales bacterium]
MPLPVADRQPLFPSAGARILFWSLCALALIGHRFFLTDDLLLDNDFGLYLKAARNLVQGLPFDHGNNQKISPPLVYPSLLALALAWSDGGLLALKTVNAVALILSGLLAFRLFRTRHPFTIALTALLFFFCSRHLILFCNLLLTELVFIVLLLTFFLLFANTDDRLRFDRAAALLLLSGLLFLTRTAAFSVLVAVAGLGMLETVLALGRRQPVRLAKYLVVGAGFAAGIAIQMAISDQIRIYLTLQTPVGAEGFDPLAFAWRVAERVVLMVRQLRFLLVPIEGQPFASLILFLPTLGLIGAGLFRCLRTGNDRWLDFFFLSYGGMLLVTSFDLENRLLLPLIPNLLWYFIEGGHQVAVWAGRSAPLRPGLTAGLMAVLLLLPNIVALASHQSRGEQIEPGASLKSPDIGALLHWLERNTTSDRVIGVHSYSLTNLRAVLDRPIFQLRSMDDPFINQKAPPRLFDYAIVANGAAGTAPSLPFAYAPCYHRTVFDSGVNSVLALEPWCNDPAIASQVMAGGVPVRPF